MKSHNEGRKELQIILNKTLELRDLYKMKIFGRITGLKKRIEELEEELELLKITARYYS